MRTKDDFAGEIYERIRQRGRDALTASLGETLPSALQALTDAIALAFAEELARFEESIEHEPWCDGCGCERDDWKPMSNASPDFGEPMSLEEIDAARKELAAKLGGEVRENTIFVRAGEHVLPALHPSISSDAIVDKCERAWYYEEQWRKREEERIDRLHAERFFSEVKVGPAVPGPENMPAMLSVDFDPGYASAGTPRSPEDVARQEIRDYRRPCYTCDRPASAHPAPDCDQHRSGR
jgi:hypothetical protein